MTTLTLLALALAQPAPHPAVLAEDLTELIVTADNTVIDRSCRVVIPPGTIIHDADGNGVLQITASDITVEFAENTALLGATIDDNWDSFTGVGVRVHNASGVTLRNLRVHAYKVGILATHADRLTVDTAELSDNYRQRLRSTPDREDASDWLFPHRNDDREWVTQHGAALAVERSDHITIREVRVRRGQNGIILDRVNDSKIYDNDASFLSGWGLALWRSSRNTISRNAFDFCVRGHSEGVYNRGQDSAGILFFEQCNQNSVVENSATHSGDGFFGFAGREALGEEPPPELGPDDAEWSYERVGCNDNLYIANDFSFAPAHGWEMTFSEGNQLWENRIVGNAICGIWGGYSSDTIIAQNEFRENGAMPYGPEHGAINIEHGSRNLIFENDFINNTTALRLWWDDDGRLLTLPGVPDRGRVDNNLFTRNRVIVEDASAFTAPRHANRVFRAVQIQDPTGAHTAGNLVGNNLIRITVEPALPIEADPGAEPAEPPARLTLPDAPFLFPPGSRAPVGARAHLEGRRNIVMGPWGPWDHQSPMLRVGRLSEPTSGRHRRSEPTPQSDRQTESSPRFTPHHYEAFGVSLPAVSAVSRAPLAVNVDRVENAPHAPPHARVTIAAPAPGVHPYRVQLVCTETGWTTPIVGVIVNAEWRLRVWAWQADPMQDLEAWRAEAEGDAVIHTIAPALDFNFQHRGPADLALIDPEAANNAGIARDRFAIIAETAIRLDAGRWRISTISDDGVRVLADGKVIIERWNIHGPTPDNAILELPEPREVALKVEHFEHDGWAALSLTIEPAD